MALPVPEDLAVGSEQQVDHETNDFSGREVVAGSLVRCFVEAPDQVLEDQAHVVIGNRDGMQVDIAEHFDNEVEPIARRAWRSPSRTRSTRISAGPWTRSLGMLIGLYWASINRLSLCLSSGECAWGAWLQGKCVAETRQPSFFLFDKESSTALIRSHNLLPLSKIAMMPAWLMRGFNASA
jgi:hypothetical protein